jgi:hypothetical protein
MHLHLQLGHVITLDVRHDLAFWSRLLWFRVDKLSAYMHVFSELVWSKTMSDAH